MGLTTTYLGLHVWDLPTDDFERAELQDNWDRIDDHDHSAGKGKQIGTSGIANGAVTSDKILDGAIGPGKLANDSITSAAIATGAVKAGEIDEGAVIESKIGAGQVTNAKLGSNAVTNDKVASGTLSGDKLQNDAINTLQLHDTAVTEPKLADAAVSTDKLVDLNVTKEKMDTCAVDARVLCDGAVEAQHLEPNLIPVGQVIEWWRPDDATPIPTGWEVCDGSTVADHDFVFAGPITLPDLRNKFILGAATSGTGTTPSLPPAVGASGGSHTKDLSHAHSITHTHTVAAHTHSIANDGHRHMFIDPDAPGNIQHLHQRGGGVKLRAQDPDTAWVQSSYVPGVNSPWPTEQHDSGDIVMTTHNHTHGGATGSATPATSGSSAANSGTAGSAVQDVRPTFVGLLRLMKVKHGA